MKPARQFSNVEEKQELQQEFNSRKFDFHNLEYHTGKLIGNSAQMKKLRLMINRVSQYNAPVLISGEPGSGKELVARTIHDQSPRNHYPFIRVGFGSSPNELLESELFGFEKKAMPGVTVTQKGKFELAKKGTIFLDDIDQACPKIQAKLTKFLVQREVERIGGYKSIVLDIRVIAASTRDLEDVMASGFFRKDLYYQLNPLKIEVPSLSLRKTDLPQIVKFYLRELSGQTGKKTKKISRKALDLLMAYHWPGNVRELKNIIERAFMIGKEDTIYPCDLPEYIKPGKPIMTMKEMQKQYVLSTLRKTNGNIATAASLLGISRGTLYAKIKE